MSTEVSDPLACSHKCMRVVSCVGVDMIYCAQGAIARLSLQTVGHSCPDIYLVLFLAFCVCLKIVVCLRFGVN